MSISCLYYTLFITITVSNFSIGLATVSKTVSKKTIGSTTVSKTVSNLSIGLGHIEFEIALFFCII